MAAQPLRCLRVLRVSTAPFALTKFCGRCAAGSHEAVVLNFRPRERPGPINPLARGRRMDPGLRRDLLKRRLCVCLAVALPRCEIWRVALCAPPTLLGGT